MEEEVTGSEGWRKVEDFIQRLQRERGDIADEPRLDREHIERHRPVFRGAGFPEITGNRGHSICPGEEAAEVASTYRRSSSDSWVAGSPPEGHSSPPRRR